VTKLLQAFCKAYTAEDGKEGRYQDEGGIWQATQVQRCDGDTTDDAATSWRHPA